MKKAIRSGVSLIVAVVMCLSLVPMTALAAYDEYVRDGNITYRIENGVFLGIRFELSSPNWDGHLAIPQGVTRIGTELNIFAAFPIRVKSITIPNSVTVISAYSFRDLPGLESLVIPNSVITIEEFAFTKSGLKSITIPDSVTSIGKYAFADASELESATIDAQTIGDYAFEGCNKLKNLSIEENVTSIGEHAFNGTGLTSVTIPDNVKSIGASAFRNSSKIRWTIIETMI